MPDQRTTTRGRPRGFDSVAVLDQALEEFWRRGYRSTTTRDLEQVLGISQSSIYNAFGSKHDLLIAALDRYERRIDSDLIEPLENDERGLEAVDGFFASFGHWITHDGKRGCMVVNMMAEDGGEDDELRARTRAYRSRVRNALRSALLRAERLGTAAVGTADARADLLIGILLGLNIAARGGAGPAELERLVGGARDQIAGWRIDG